jgi:hypothetical protein
MIDMDAATKNNIGRTIQTILTSLMTVAVIYMASFAADTSKELALVKQSLGALTAQVVAMQNKIDSMQVNYVTQTEFKDHEDRIRVLEQRRK